MENKIPFTSYDFWAYLSSGFLLLFVTDYVASTQFFERESWTVVQGIVAISAAYAIGQLVASASSITFERLLVGKLLGYPSNVLFGSARAWPWIKLLLPSYFHSLPYQVQRINLEKGAIAGINTHGEELFYVAHANAKANPAVMARLDNFLNLYGFCRNIAFVALLGSVMLYWSYWFNNGPVSNLYWSRMALSLIHI